MNINDIIGSWTTFLLLAAILVAILLDIQVRTNQIRKEREKHQQKK